LIDELEKGTWIITNQSELYISEERIYVQITLFEVRDFLPQYDTRYVDFSDEGARCITKDILIDSRHKFKKGTFIKDNSEVTKINSYMPANGRITIPKYRHLIGEYRHLSSVKISTLGEISKTISWKMFSKDTFHCEVGIIKAYLNYGRYSNKEVRLILNGLDIFNNFFKGSKKFTYACLNQTFPDYWNNQFCNPYMSFCTNDYNDSKLKSVYVRLRKHMEDTDAKEVSMIIHDQRVTKYLERLNRYIGLKKGKFSLPPYFLFSNKKVDIDVTARVNGWIIPSDNGPDYYLPADFYLDCYDPPFDEVIFSRDNDGRTGKIKKAIVKRGKKKIVPFLDDKGKNEKDDNSSDDQDEIDIKDLTDEEYNMFLPQVENLVQDQFSIMDSIKATKEEKHSSTSYETDYQFIPIPYEKGRFSFNAWYGGLNKGNVASIKNDFQSDYNFNDLIEGLKEITQSNNGSLRYYDLTYSVFKSIFIKTRVTIPKGKSVDEIPNEYFISRWHKKYKQGRLAIIAEIELHNEKIILIDFEPKQEKNTVITILKFRNSEEIEMRKAINLIFTDLTKSRLVSHELNTHFRSFDEDIKNFEFMIHKTDDNHNYFLRKIEKLVDTEEFSNALVYKDNENEKA